MALPEIAPVAYVEPAHVDLAVCGLQEGAYTFRDLFERYLAVTRELGKHSGSRKGFALCLARHPVVTRLKRSNGHTLYHIGGETP